MLYYHVNRILSLYNIFQLQKSHTKKACKKWREAEFQITKMLYTAAAKAATYIITRQCRQYVVSPGFAQTWI